MATEYENSLKNYACKTKIREDSKVIEKDFQHLVEKNIPSWTAVWNMLFQQNNEMRKRQYRTVQPLDLQKKIKKKISELVDKEETLVGLYSKAAEVAKNKEKEFNDKSANLTEQLKKDKHLIKMFKHLN